MGAKFSTAEKTAELNAHEETLLAAAQAWLEKHEPDHLQVNPLATISAALQALGNAEALRQEALPLGHRGVGWVNALAHSVALICLQQNRAPHLVFDDFSLMVQAKAEELMADGVENHMVGAALKTQGEG